jgi:transposase
MLETLARSSSAPHREVQRARALLMAANGAANDRIAAELAVSATSVRSWRQRFTDDGLKRFGRVRPGRGAKPSIPPEMVEAIVAATLQTTPPGQTHWSCRTMAAEFGVSPATVQRIWHARGLKPHLVETFKLSNDPAFEEKLTDVVGLYLDPPEKAVVLCNGREEPGAGTGPDPAVAADEKGPRRHHILLPIAVPVRATKRAGGEREPRAGPTRGRRAVVPMGIT